MSEVQAAPKAKKGVALAGITAGNTALCTVGHTGNDLHYRGYDILDVAEHCEFEEIAYLLVHGALPNLAQLTAYKAKLRALRGLPRVVREVLEALPAATHPMDVLRTGISALGCALPEKEDHNVGRRPRYRGPHHGVRRIDAAVLVSLDAERPPYRRRNVRRQHRRAFPASAAWRSAVTRLGAGDAHEPDPVCRA